MQCVRTVSYQIVHARREIGPIVPTRGLCQGDPLSTYLFILYAEGLSALLNRYESLKLIKGVRVCKRAPAINHMLFADDSYLYCKASEDEAHRMMEILSKYEMASGQMMEEADENSKYLGLPNMMQRSKVTTFSLLKDKVKKRTLS
ncbi:uncharacterized protein LOC141714172 [Apium graveolens]|uniref:uncharacterized protein LOC141714172 n=1 Tax=Apium graveolens TaxID=4045 RepID=UPI003D78CE6D